MRWSRVISDGSLRWFIFEYLIVINIERLARGRFEFRFLLSPFWGEKRGGFLGKDWEIEGFLQMWDEIFFMGLPWITLDCFGYMDG